MQQLLDIDEGGYFGLVTVSWETDDVSWLSEWSELHAQWIGVKTYARKVMDLFTPLVVASVLVLYI